MESQKTDLFNQEMELNRTRIKLNRLITLNLSLYNSILAYARRKGIPLTLDASIVQLVEKIADTDEITLPVNRRKVTDRYRDNGTDEEVPVP